MGDPGGDPDDHGLVEMDMYGEVGRADVKPFINGATWVFNGG
jgi:hypothetical protein